MLGENSTLTFALRAQTLRCMDHRVALRIALCLALAAAPAAASCQIYMGSSSTSGSIVLSNFESAEANVLLLRADADAVASRQRHKGFAGGTQRAKGAVSSEVVQIVDAVADRTAVSPQLIHAVIAAESGYVPNAVSPRGAIGLMQLIPATASRFGAKDPLDPHQNISAGAQYLKWLMDYFGGDLELVLAAYNAGENAVIKAGRKIPPYPETQAYVRKILADLRSQPSSRIHVPGQ